jgi:putative chitinase
MDNARRAQQRLVERGFALIVDGDFGAKSLAALMSWIGGRPVVSQLRTDLGAAAARHFPAAGIATPLRLAHALAQQSVETGGFTQMAESLNYSAKALRGTFGRHRISDADCQRLARRDGEKVVPVARQKEIANLVYGGKWGRDNLGNDQPGDGWRFRGRGAKQTTGRSNYGKVRDVTGLDVLDRPELLEDPDTGMKAACIYWQDRGCNALADADDVTALSIRINGGQNGLDGRKAALKRAREILL